MARKKLQPIRRQALTRADGAFFFAAGSAREEGEAVVAKSGVRVYVKPIRDVSRIAQSRCYGIAYVTARDHLCAQLGHCRVAPMCRALFLERGGELPNVSAAVLFRMAFDGHMRIPTGPPQPTPVLIYRQARRRGCIAAITQTLRGCTPHGLSLDQLIGVLEQTPNAHVAELEEPRLKRHFVRRMLKGTPGVICVDNVYKLDSDAAA